MFGHPKRDSPVAESHFKAGQLPESYGAAPSRFKRLVAAIGSPSGTSTHGSAFLCRRYSPDLRHWLPHLETNTSERPFSIPPTFGGRTEFAGGRVVAHRLIRRRRRKLPCPYGRVVGSPRWAAGVPGDPRGHAY
eukprot:1184018-Prorocentrum_minimum.AAC.1